MTDELKITVRDEFDEKLTRCEPFFGLLWSEFNGEIGVIRLNSFIYFHF